MKFMKKDYIKFSIMLIIALVYKSIITLSISQTPQRMSYQAVIRDASNKIIKDQNVGMRISILQGSPTGGYVVYTEMQYPTTNENGLISIEIGGLYDFNNIVWSNGPYYLKTETDPSGGTDYTITGTSQILSVPYALHAKTAESITGGLAFSPPSATPLDPYNLQSSSATMNGLVNGNGFLTTVAFEWGLANNFFSSFESVTPSESPVTGIYDASVSATLTGLKSGTDYHYRIKVSNAVNVVYSNIMNFTTLTSIPELTTTPISSITGTSASSGGNITHNGGLQVTLGGVCYGISPNPTHDDNATLQLLMGSTTFISQLSGLTPGTTYYVRAYGTNSNGTGYGNEYSFTTASPPTVTTSNIYDVRGNSTQAGGSVTNTGGSPILSSGLCWSTSHGPTTASSKNTSFGDPMTGLTTNTTYYARAYATNIVGTSYGDEISFNSGFLIGTETVAGIIFWNSGTGHGMMCPGFDQSTGSQWGCWSTLISGTSLSVFTGEANTNLIVAACGEANTAAKICHDLVLGGYSDWYLPSVDDLQRMYANLKSQNLGNFANSFYWSSSESSANNAYRRNFQDGTYSLYDKSNTLHVRAVRSF